jgi:hypothetical protein
MKRLLLAFLLIGTAHAQTIPQFTTGETVSAAKLNAATKGPLDVLSIGVGLPATGQFYVDSGAHVTRPRDWLSDITIWPVYSAQAASLSRVGATGFVGGSRTSDAKANATALGYTPSSIGVGGFGFSDDTTSPTATTSWGFYGEGWRLAGVNYSLSFSMELDSVNMGPNINGSNPYHQNTGGGTYGIQLGSGASQVTSSNAETGITFVSNPSKWNNGIVFGATSLAGTDGSIGDTGFGTAIAMSRNQGVTWFAPNGLMAAFIYSTVTDPTLGNSIVHANSAIVFQASGTGETMAIQNSGNLIMPTAGAYIEMGSYSGTSAPGIDFHSSGNGDFDSRMVATGGNSGVSGQGTLDFYAGSVAFHGPVTVLYGSGSKLNLLSVPSYANNAAAVSAGLNVGDVYYNSTVTALSVRQ